MIREYPLYQVDNWYFELLDAVKQFEREFMKKPNFVGYSETIYNQINLVANQNKTHIVDDEGKHPEEDEFIELGSVTVEEHIIYILFCDNFPDNKFALMTEPPDGGDDGEPKSTLEDKKADLQWSQAS